MFLPNINRKYVLKVRNASNLHRQPKQGQKVKKILCKAEARIMVQDWCVRWKNRFLEIPRSLEALSLSGKWVEVRELKDGNLLLRGQGQRLSWSFVESARKQAKANVNNRSSVSKPDHPWRTHPACQRAWIVRSCQLELMKAHFYFGTKHLASVGRLLFEIKFYGFNTTLMT